MEDTKKILILFNLGIFSSLITAIYFSLVYNSYHGYITWFMVCLISIITLK